MSTVKQATAPDPRGGSRAFEYTNTPDTVVADTALSLRAAQAQWGAQSHQARLAVLGKFRDSLARSHRALSHALEGDTGRRLLAGVEVDGVIGRIDYWQAHADRFFAADSDGLSATAPSVRYVHQWVPLPLVGVISPWNFPMLLTFADTLPALVAGCAVIAKPSEVTPRFIEPLQACIDEVPELSAVLQVLPGAADTGRAVIDAVDAICFTGSVATGRHVGAQAGSRLIPAFLELGGKDPLLVLEDADVTLAARTALRASVISTGQACQSIERVYVHEGLLEKFVELVVRDAREVEPNMERVDQGHLGPFIDSRQADIVQSHLTDALDKGAQQHCGAIHRRDGGAWATPIVLTNVNHDMKIMGEETFGPVIPIMPFKDDAEAIALANDTDFGLSAAVFGVEHHAIEVAKQINAGAVSVNDGGLTTQVSDVEKDAFGASGVGRSRMGTSALRRFFRRKAILIQSAEPAPIGVFAEQPEQDPGQ